MKKGLTELVFILDRSGSMSGLEADTIGGFNSMLEKQKRETGDAFVSVVLFDDRTEILYDRVDIRRIEPMNENQYYVRGCTALLDAIGGAIHHIGNVHKYAREEDLPEKTLFIITTDGMENASHNYSYDQVKKMIEHEKEQYHWEFLFLGANIDAVSVAGRFGIDRTRAVRYEHDEEGTRLNFRVMSKAVSCARKSSRRLRSQIYDNIKHRQRDKEPGSDLPVFYFSCDRCILISVLMDKQPKNTSQMITIRGISR